MALTLDLQPGVALPLLGFGTWQLKGEAAYNSTRFALQVGYRHVDTATAYFNQRAVGRALADSGVPRAGLFVTTKIPPYDVGRERRTLQESLGDLGIEAVDLWMLQWTLNGQPQPDVWERMAALRDEGLARALGVSNYSVPQLDELIRATGVVPAVNQVRWGPLLHDPELLAAHRDRGVALLGYSPLNACRLRDPVLREIAAGYGVTPAQVVLRWHLEHGIPTAPRSSHPDRIRENAAVGDLALTPLEVARIDALSEVAGSRVTVPG